MVKWYLRQRLSVKLVMPSILVVILLSTTGIMSYRMVVDQNTLQRKSVARSLVSGQLSELIEEYSRIQAHLYKSVALAYAGIDVNKTTAEMLDYISRQAVLEEKCSSLANNPFFLSSKPAFDSAQKYSTKYFKWVKEVGENIDDPGLAVSNMVTTEKQFNQFKQTLVEIQHSQEQMIQNNTLLAEKKITGLQRWQLLSTLLVALFALGIAFINQKLFTSFARKAKNDVSAIAGGDLTHAISVSSGDELGDLVHSVDLMRQNFRTLLQSLSTTINQLTESSRLLNESSENLTDNATKVNDRTLVISTAGQTVSSLASQMAGEAQNVSVSTTETANALQQMNTTIQEISRNCLNEVQMAQQAGLTVQKAMENITELGRASVEIGGILKIIDDIAGKTRLLALNATIEAASAGEAGRGFAVVAEEVKNLAVQSNSAASQIQQNVEAIQSQVAGAVATISTISKSINQFSEISNTISAAVEEQAATVGTISSSVSTVSRSTGTLVNGIDDVAQKSDNVLSAIRDVGEVMSTTSREAVNTMERAKILSEIGKQLSESVAKFKV